MKASHTHILKVVAVLAAFVAIFSGCHEHNTDGPGGPQRVVIMYEAGFNSLSSDLQRNNDYIKAGWLPGKNGTIMLIYSRLATDSGYKTPTESNLVRIYKEKGKVVTKNICTYSENTVAVDPSTVTRVLNTVKEKFPDAASYGMIFSSHGTGWLPDGYYNNGTSGSTFSVSDNCETNKSIQSIGQEYVMTKNEKEEWKRESVEMEIEDFAAAIPMHLDFILFDACLMGGVEVAYALRKAADYVVFSPAEILSEGFNYNYFGLKMLKPAAPLLADFCFETYNYYMNQSNVDLRSITLSIFETKYAGELAAVCKTIFEKYRKEIALIAPSEVQRYHRYGKHWFYDLEDIVANIPVEESMKNGLEADLKNLHDVLEKAVPYKVASPSFIPNGSGFMIDNYSGLSMYLPCNGSKELDTFYKTLSWNWATELVK